LIDTDTPQIVGEGAGEGQPGRCRRVHGGAQPGPTLCFLAGIDTFAYVDANPISLADAVGLCPKVAVGSFAFGGQEVDAGEGSVFVGALLESTVPGLEVGSLYEAEIGGRDDQ
jgi:hypothetical protein